MPVQLPSLVQRCPSFLHVISAFPSCTGPSLLAVLLPSNVHLLQQRPGDTSRTEHPPQSLLPVCSSGKGLQMALDRNPGLLTMQEIVNLDSV